ncbi:hypothetical protein D9M71_292470 [compost metagenome]
MNQVQRLLIKYPRPDGSAPELLTVAAAHFAVEHSQIEHCFLLLATPRVERYFLEDTEVAENRLDGETGRRHGVKFERLVEIALVDRTFS